MKTPLRWACQKFPLRVGILLSFFGLIASANAGEVNISTKDIMTAMVIPASDALWAIGMDDDSTPKSDEYWTKLQNNAVQLIVAGMVMSSHGDPNATGKDKEKKWQDYNKELISIANAALQAARAKNFDETLDAGNNLLDICSTCHQDFMPGAQQ